MFSATVQSLCDYSKWSSHSTSELLTTFNVYCSVDQKREVTLEKPCGYIALLLLAIISRSTKWLLRIWFASERWNNNRNKFAISTETVIKVRRKYDQWHILFPSAREGFHWRRAPYADYDAYFSWAGPPKKKAFLDHHPKEKNRCGGKQGTCKGR